LNTSRRLSMFSVKSFRRRSSSVAVKKNVPSRTKARIYCGIRQALPNCSRRDAFHFPALRLLDAWASGRSWRWMGGPHERQPRQNCEKSGQVAPAQPRQIEAPGRSAVFPGTAPHQFVSQPQDEPQQRYRLPGGRLKPIAHGEPFSIFCLCLLLALYSNLRDPAKIELCSGNLKKISGA